MALDTTPSPTATADEIAGFVHDHLARKHAVDTAGIDGKTFNELYVDSLGVVQLGMKVKKRFGVEFEAGEITGADTVGDVVAAIGARLSAAGHGADEVRR
ncbi:MAG: acyl carrier protein [Corynebacteriales bacterium]|uniref:Acyl carrier protein n=1 Tax=Williamsia herbipolensis TaxID=1603258 RepID=A0AAU4K7C0_9NOCA|nr:acyl carrier protein [Williamsia herbipolensis]MCX6469818.1 acyl carrier protein [Mycobacteriales bacterium]